MTSNSDVEMSLIMQNIFDECDLNGDGMVRVSMLIDYITPYMRENECQLENIRSLLDPLSSDREVTSVEFFTSMNVWVDKYNQHANLRDLNQTASSLNSQSTGDSTNVTNASNDVDRSALEEQIHQLTFENKNIYDELHIVRAQLLSQEEQMEALQTEQENLIKKLNTERELNESLVSQNQSFDENSELNVAKQRQIDKLEKEAAHNYKLIAEFKKTIDNHEHQNQKNEEKLVSMHEKLAKCRHEIGDLTTAIHLKNDQIKYFEESKEVMCVKMKDLELKLVNINEKNKCLLTEKDALSNTLQEVITQRNRESLAEVKAIKSACKNQSTQTTTRRSTSPVPFASPIKTTNFQFYNYDSPVAKRCLQQQNENAIETTRSRNTQESETQTVSPFTPTLRQSLPHLYIIERSDPKRNEKSGELNLSASGTEEELLQLQIGAITQSNRKSLMDEMVEYQESMKLTCENCQELCAKIETFKTENEALNNSLTECKDLEISNKLLISNNEELKLALQQRDEELKQKSDEIATVQESYENELAKLNELNASFATLQDTVTQGKSQIITLSQELQIIAEEKRLYEAKISELNETLDERQMQVKNAQEENKRVLAEYANEIDEYSKEFERNRSGIDELCKKFNDSVDFAVLLKSEKEELLQINTSLATKHVEYHDELEMMRAELQCLKENINKAIDKPIETQLKLSELINNNNHYKKLKGKYEDIVKQFEDNIVKSSTPTKMPHDKTQLKIEKLVEKKEYLEELVRLNRIKINGLNEDVEKLEMRLERVTNERNNLSKDCDNLKVELETIKNDYAILANCAKTLADNASAIRGKITSLVQLYELQVDETLLHAMERENCIVNEEGNGDGICLSETMQYAAADLDLFAKLVETLSHCELRSNGHSMPKCGKGKRDLSRSSSPDRPSLEILHIRNSHFDDNDANHIDIETMYIEDPLSCIENLYQSNTEDNFEALSFHQNNLGKQVVTLDELVVSLMFDYYGNRKQIRKQLNDIRDNVQHLSSELRSLVFIKGTRRKNEALTKISRYIHALFKGIESYGALKEEVKMAAKINLLMSHTLQLHAENLRMKQAKEERTCVATQTSRRTSSAFRLKSFMDKFCSPIYYCFLAIAFGFLLVFCYENVTLLPVNHIGVPICWSNFWEFLEIIVTPSLPPPPV